MIKINKEITMTIKSQAAEDLHKAYVFLSELQETLDANDFNVAVSQDTGECFELDELGRVRGILSGLIETTKWTLE